MGDIVIPQKRPAETILKSEKKSCTVEATEVTPPRSPEPSLKDSLSSLYTESASGKIWGVALRGLALKNPPLQYPEHTPPGGGSYVTTVHDFWTSGFFPGSLHLLCERQIKYPQSVPTHVNLKKLRSACEWWTENLHANASMTNTHDLGFMIMPWAQQGWELFQDIKCHNSMITAAYALASRFDKKVGAIRSWDICLTKRYSFTNTDDAFLVIIDSMMNLNLLYYVSKLVDNPNLATIATTHATTLMNSHIREDNSTFHVVDFQQTDGSIKQRFTNQGYSDDSCWSRGQAWGIAGYAQTYAWTNDEKFRLASERLADHFLQNLSEDGVPDWDFRAPKDGRFIPKDTSAALAAAYGMLLLHKHTPGGAPAYFKAAIRLITAATSSSLSSPASFAKTEADDVDIGTSDTIMLRATINNYEFAPRRWADHGLVYADYYFLLIGNLLLEMGVL